MTDTQTVKPWEELSRLADEASQPQLATFLDQLPPSDVALAMSRLPDEKQSAVLTLLAPQHAAELVDHLPDAQAVELVEHLDPQAAAAILDALPSDEQPDLIGDLDDRDASAILDEMDPKDAADARALSQYADDVAGGLMVTEYLKYSDQLSVGDVVEDRRMSTVITTCNTHTFVIAFVHSAFPRFDLIRTNHT